MIIEMKKFGHSLVSRAAGRAAYESITSSAEWGTDKAVFDFAGVGTITYSFADEVFGRMALEMGMESLRASTTFANITPFMARIVRTAIDARIRQRESRPTTA